MKFRSFVGLVAALCVIAAGSIAAAASDLLTVHEWGTFTVLQDEHGNAIRGINADDEPVPEFVHNLHQFLVQGPTQLPPIYFKGAPRSEGDVYVRLETPVIYFHPPEGFNHKVDVQVAFRGGWITQFYPTAKVDAPGLQEGRFEFGNLTDDTVGTLQWKDLQLGLNRPGPVTTDPVWTAPRKVDAATVTAPDGETEKYLFYRGVGHLKAPLRAQRSADGNAFDIQEQFGPWVKLPAGYSIGPLWLVDIRPDGTFAHRNIDRINLTPAKPLTAFPRVDSNFKPADYRKDLAPLRASMHAAMVREGLYADEADALLNTWEVSYFRRPGLRLFYIVPRLWTDHFLPLTISESADVQRVMIGRIEVVTPRQRDLLAKIAKGPLSDPQWLDKALQKLGGNAEDFYRQEWYQRLMDGKQSLT